jgi:hypothetical protein
MPTQQNQSCIETGNTGWISIHINDSQTPIDLSSSYNKDPQHEAPLLSPVIFHLFEHQREIQAPFPERFPRLTLLAIAIALLASALAAEFDYLHGAGYYSP